MKTIKHVIRENPDYTTLIRAVVSRIGKDSIQDVNNHGIDGGFGGFIYYTETMAFFRKHRAIILKMAEEMAEQLGENILSMIHGFRCIGEDYSTAEIAKAIYTGKGDCVDVVYNAMAWFAAEEVCRMFEN